MKANIELTLRTREVYQLFERKINGNQLFIPAILHKFNRVMQDYNQQESEAFSIYKWIESKMQQLTQQFAAEITKFETILQKKKLLENKRIDFVVQFKTIIAITNPLTIQLVEIIEIYDKLMAILKLMNLAGCFETDEIYFQNVKRIQKIANQGFSEILLARLVSH